MKKFMEPNVNVEVLDLVDVITTSNDVIVGDGSDQNNGSYTPED